MLRSEDLGCDSNHLERTSLVAERVTLNGARHISPLWHPESCTGLSGLYAIINAIQLALANRYTFSARELHSLTSAGLRFMSGRLTPQQAVLSGLRVSLWCALAEAMVTVARRQTRVLLSVERLFVAEAGREAVFDTIEQAIMHMRVPMMLCRGGHYTVVKGFTRSSFLLLDSSGAYWMAKHACGVPGDCTDARHVLYPNSFLALNV